MKVEEMIRELPGPPVEEWIARLPGGGELIDGQYAGPKAALRPIYERVAEVIAGFEDVEVGPRGTYVSFGRPKQFALVKASTRSRVDVGLRAAYNARG